MVSLLSLAYAVHCIASHGLLEALLRGLPVDDIPDGAEVFCFAVLVLEVVCVLPSVDAENRSELANDWVLVRVCLDLNSASVHILYQPCPTRALDTCESSVYLRLEVVERAEVRIDGLGQGAAWWLTTALVLWCEVLPEERVVCVTA